MVTWYAMSPAYGKASRGWNCLRRVWAVTWWLNDTDIINSEYEQEIPQSQTADNPVAPRGRAAQPSRDTRKTN